MQPKFYGAAADYNKPKFGLNGRLFKIIGLIVLALVGISAAFAIVGLINSGPSNNLAALIAREQSLQKFISTNQKAINGSDLAKLSADASIYMTSDSVTLKKLLTSRYGVAKIPDEITRRETDSTSAAKLKSATQINQFDKTYAELLRDKLAATIELAQIVEQESNNSLKSAVQQSIKNLQSIDNQLNAVKS